MEHLTKQQMILLALLVSFITSIATGITTVSLMDQAPVGVTQTINRVVEHTIQTVTTAAAASPIIHDNPPKETNTTVVVKEEDLVVGAVKALSASVVRIRSKHDGALLGLGTVVATDGTIVTDEGLAGKAKEYDFEALYKGVVYDLKLVGKIDAAGLAFFRLPPEASPTPVVFADTAKLASGQSAIAISGGDRDIVAIGIISSLITGAAPDASSTAPVKGLNTTIAESSLMAGSPFGNLEGKLIAIKAGQSDSLGDTIVTGNLVQLALSQLGK